MLKTKDRTTPLWNAAKIKYWEFMRKIPHIADIRCMYLKEVLHYMRIPKEVVDKYTASQLTNTDGTFRDFVRVITQWLSDPSELFFACDLRRHLSYDGIELPAPNIRKKILKVLSCLKACLPDDEDAPDPFEEEGTVNGKNNNKKSRSNVNRKDG